MYLFMPNYLDDWVLLVFFGIFSKNACYLDRFIAPETSCLLNFMKIERAVLIDKEFVFMKHYFVTIQYYGLLITLQFFPIFLVFEDRSVFGWLHYNYFFLLSSSNPIYCWTHASPIARHFGLFLAIKSACFF